MRLSARLGPGLVLVLALALTSALSADAQEIPVRVRGLEQSSEPQVYLPYKQVDSASLIGYTPKDLVIRSTLLQVLTPEHLLASLSPQPRRDNIPSVRPTWCHATRAGRPP